MLIQGQVGPSSAQSVQPGTPAVVRQGQLGDVIVSELHGRYYEQAYRRNMFSIAANTNTTGTALSVGSPVAGTAWYGISIYNPPGSPVNLVVNKVSVLPTVASATTYAAFAVGTGTSPTAPSGTTAVTPRNNYYTGAAPVGQVYTAATYGVAAGGAAISATPQYLLGFNSQLTATSWQNQGAQYFDLEGSIVVPPTGFVYLHILAGSTTTAATPINWASFAWEEVPV
jgi:hypothetical protein